MKPDFVAVVLADEFTAGRWLLCRRNRHGWTTVVEDCPTEASAEDGRRRLQAEYDFAAARPPVDPDAPRQLVLGFYTDEDAR